LPFSSLYDHKSNDPSSFSTPNNTTQPITMSAAYEGQDPMVIAKQAERDLAAQKDVKTLSDSGTFLPPSIS